MCDIAIKSAPRVFHSADSLVPASKGGKIYFQELWCLSKVQSESVDSAESQTRGRLNLASQPLLMLLALEGAGS